MEQETPANGDLPFVDSQLLLRYDRPAPRYTSYPTAVEFGDDYGADDYAAGLDRMDAGSEVSLYAHLPFCEHRCTFCGCHVVITQKRDVAATYLDYLEREIDLVRRRLPTDLKVVQYHWGGGTPTYYTPDQMRELHESLSSRFDLQPNAEVAVEVDPRVTTTEHVDALVELGFNRLSMGVQDFTPDVQEEIGRSQTEAETRELFDYCRGKKELESINIDLIYGLPRQTEESFAVNLESVLDIRPDRVALYSYAHVPWVRGHQMRMNTDLLPTRDEKFSLFAAAIRAFRDSGYRQIGMDHFALPDDELSLALGQRRLHRNFMGYTVQRAPVMIGLGISAIGDVDHAYVQNKKKLSTYYSTVEAGELPVERGYSLSDDDCLRRHVIIELMCNLYVDMPEAEGFFGISFADYFSVELAELAEGPEKDGFVILGSDTIEVTPLGQLFLRNVCMIFDRYLREKPRTGPTFSRTV